MLRCFWLPVAAVHHIHHAARHLGRAVRRLRRHHRAVYRWTCVSVGALGTSATGLGAGWGVGTGFGYWWPSLTVWGTPGLPAWPATATGGTPIPVPEPSTLMLLAIPLALAFVIVWRDR